MIPVVEPRTDQAVGKNTGKGAVFESEPRSCMVSEPAMGAGHLGTGLPSQNGHPI
jgi:hypothetical protein